MVRKPINARVYRIVNSEDNLGVKISRKCKNKIGSLDLIFETQLLQTLQVNANSDLFFPKVTEELIVVNEETKTLLNYVVLVECPEFSLINMLEGPTAGNVLKNPDAEEGYHS